MNRYLIILLNLCKTSTFIYFSLNFNKMFLSCNNSFELFGKLYLEMKITRKWITIFLLLDDLKTK